MWRLPAAEFTPPSGTRAYFRGRCVSKFSKSLYGASWTSVLFDVGNTTIKKMPLMDPLRGTEALTAELLDRPNQSSPDREALLCKVLKAYDEASFSPRSRRRRVFSTSSTRHHPELTFRMDDGGLTCRPRRHEPSRPVQPVPFRMRRRCWPSSIRKAS